MMQRILKGDTSGQIALALADGYNYAGCVVEFRYQGAVRTFRNCEVGQTIQFNFTAAETAVMALGAFPVTVRLFTPDGRFFTVNNADVKIEVTDCVADVREGGVIVVEASSGLYGVDDLPERYTTKDIREKINEIIQRLGGGVAALCLAACVACGSLFGAGVNVTKSNLEDIHNDEKVVTGVTFDASGLATTAGVEQAMRKKDGAARMLPPYLWCRDFFDSYENDAAWYYALADIGGACSSVRDGNAYSRNFDFPYDERAEFVVRMAAGPDRFASVGVSNVGTNLTEAIVTSGKPSRFYKAIPGATVDGINERGVAANINVVPANGAEGTVWAGHEINAVGGVRWVLDHATSAGMAASNLAAKVYIPDALIRKGYSAHFMVADECETWIVEDGVARKVDGRAVLTNFRLYAQDDPFGTGYERHALLASGGNITSAWFRAAYRRPFTRPTEFAAPGVGTHTETNALVAWANANVPQGAPESLTRNGKSWQTVHCSVYDLSNRVLRVAVQETPDWYVFGIPASGGGAVQSVNGKTGAVTLGAADVGAYATADGVDIDNENVTLRSPYGSSFTSSYFYPGSFTFYSAEFGTISEFDSLGVSFSGNTTGDGTYDASYGTTRIRAARQRSADGVTEEANLTFPYGWEGVIATSNMVESVVEDRIESKRDMTNLTYVADGYGWTDTIPDWFEIEPYVGHDPWNPVDSEWYWITEVGGWSFLGDRSFASEDDAYSAADVTWRDIYNPQTGDSVDITLHRGPVQIRDRIALVSEATNRYAKVDGIDIDSEGWWSAHDGPSVRIDAPSGGSPAVYLGDAIHVGPSTVTMTDGSTMRFALDGRNGDITTDDVLADATNAAISATNPAFSNAVVNVTLPIGTNELAVLREIGDLPIGEGAATIGGLLAALAAAVAWLRKNKVEKYALASATTAAIKAADRSVTKVTLGATAVTVTLPDADTGKTRDFLLRIDAANLATGGSLTITKPTGATIYGDDFPSPETGKQYLVTITETAANEFYVRSLEITIPTEA